MSPFDLLVAGVVLIAAVRRGGSWMHRRGWIQWKPRGASSALGNAVMQVQLIYQPQIREVLEQRLAEPDEAGESGDPPDPGGGIEFRASRFRSSAPPSRCSAGSE